jgi:hypothetical protein
LTLQPINIFLRYTINSLIKQKVHPTISQQSDDILKVSVAIDLFTRAFLVLLINLSLAEYAAEFAYLPGKFTDFSVEWFLKVGDSLFFLMLICIWTPLIETATEWLLKWL